MRSGNYASISMAILKIIFFTIGMCNPIVLEACETDMILEKKDIQFLRIQQSSDPSIRLSISGLVFHSSLAVKSIKTHESNGVLQIEICLAPARNGLSGNISYDFNVPETVNKVVLGNEQAIIWTR